MYLFDKTYKIFKTFCDDCDANTFRFYLYKKDDKYMLQCDLCCDCKTPLRIEIFIHHFLNHIIKKLDRNVSHFLKNINQEDFDGLIASITALSTQERTKNDYNEYINYIRVQIENGYKNTSDLPNHLEVLKDVF